MQSKTFTFSQNNSSNWHKVRDTLNAFLNEIVRNSTLGHCKKDFEVEVRLISKKRSGAQLKSFWRLVRVIRDYMNSKGNFFNDEEIAAWIKISAGHFHTINGEKIAKSIANKSTTTVDDMIRILEFMLDFGAEHKIKDCYIASTEYDEIINFYK